MTDPVKRLKAMGIALAKPTTPVANYVGFVRSGNLLFVSGQVALRDGKLHYAGHLGDNVSLEDGQHSARQAALNIITLANVALDGDLTRVARVVKVSGFVAATPTFTDHPKVVNGASDFFVDVFGERGRHARAAVGVPSLPLGASVEIEAVFEVE